MENMDHGDLHLNVSNESWFLLPRPLPQAMDDMTVGMEMEGMRINSNGSHNTIATAGGSLLQRPAWFLHLLGAMCTAT